MGSMTMEGVVIEVELRKGNRKSDNQPYVCYDIIDQDNVKWVAWERELAERAFNLKGQAALWQVEIVQNGNYTNRTLRGIDAKTASGFEPALKAMEASIGGFNEKTAFPEPGQPVQIPGDPGVPRDTDRYIWRQCATKVAAQLGGTANEFWENSLALVNFYETGVSPAITLDQLIATGAVQLGTNAPGATTSFSPSTEPFPTQPPQDDDIPF